MEKWSHSSCQIEIDSSAKIIVSVEMENAFNSVNEKVG